ncbi:hypothetical protein R1sor_017843 [Riccia sorocarpa]|uniref:CUE domain-containing protein n=1 Tax=Riccia sorocarpa TaxID=122646 RepID=A0ABD3IC05_9MARC
MAWRASYSALLEIFPQVDTRLIKGAALHHGEDLVEAADFILNEVLGSADDIANEEEDPVIPAERRTSESLSTRQNSGDRPVAGNISEGEYSSGITKLSENGDTEISTHTAEEAFGGQAAPTGLLVPVSSNSGIPEGTSKEEAKPVMSHCITEVVYSISASSPLDCGNPVGPPQLLPGSGGGTQHMPGISSDTSSAEEVQNSASELFAESSGKSHTVVGDVTGDRYDLEGEGDSSAEEKGESVGTSEEILETVRVESVSRDASNSGIEESDVKECMELDPESGRDSAYISINVESGMVGDALVRDPELEMTISTKISIIEEYETGEGCWETVSSTSTRMASMETLLESVEQAKADKEVLINSIEELRALRQRTDEEEYAARAAKDEAQKGGRDIMAQVAEMRQMLSRAREANEVHAAEVHGEKAVLATEARELQSRLVQLKGDKERALYVLNEIKASLQARIDKACQERELAVAEKAAKEAIARECLMKEEAAMAQVAQESRELQAETETCKLLRDFLIERGNIVDALQGEVAVLCEDAEELKEEIERISLSCSSGFVHMLKPPRPLGDSSSSSLSRSGKVIVSPRSAAHSLECMDQGDIPFDGGVAAVSPARSLTAGQRSVGDKRLPSLRRALSGSQDLSGSLHSSVNSTSVVSNLGASIRSVTKPVTEVGDGSGIPDDEFSSPHGSLSGSEAERKLYQAQMAMFADESDLIDFRTSNLDIFRVESSAPTVERKATSSDDDDWHLLDMAVGQTRSSSESSCSSYAEK